ncbi:MAG: hypothetical protein NZ853_03045 [Leptospiraceae bacterium]|nr:hypothetical protein [Leptospiraceae bacterium]MDW7975151.1 hypothetical protein [Leptospiraceae bacterium]
MHSQERNFVGVALQSKEKINNEKIQNWISLLETLPFLVKGGIDLYHWDEYILRPNTKFVGCLENYAQECYEVMNYFYEVYDVVLELVLDNPKAPSHLLKEVLRLLKLPYENEFSNFSEEKELIYHLKWKILNNEQNHSFLILGIFPKETYKKSYFWLDQVFASTNIIPKNALRILIEDEFENLQEHSEILFIADNSYSMKEKFLFFEEQWQYFAKTHSAFFSSLRFGLITMYGCQYQELPKTENSNKEKSHQVEDTQKFFYESCLLCAETFISEKTNKNIAFVCLSDEGDYYSKITQKKFSERDNLFLKKAIPVFGILPMDHYGNITDCIGNLGKTKLHFKYDKKEKNELAIDYKLLSRLTKGLTFSICNSDYQFLFKTIAYQTLGHHSKFKLSRLPIQSTIEVQSFTTKIRYLYLDEREFDPNQTYFFYHEKENAIVLVGNQNIEKIQIRYRTMEF